MLLAAGCAARPTPRAADGSLPALVLDGTLVDPAAQRTLLDRLRAAGLAPVYRRFEPRLGEEDLARYRVVVWLAGRTRGSAGGLAVTAEEGDRAVRLVGSGGRLVLGAAPGRPGAEGQAFQAILDRLGVPIRIGPHEVVDLGPDSSYPASLMRAPLFAPDPAVAARWRIAGRIVGGRSAPLEVGEGARVLLGTLPTAFLDALYGPPPADPRARGPFAVAADAPAGSRGGRVLVASRALLGAGGTLAHTNVEPLLPGRLPAGALEGRERLLAAALADLLAGMGPPGGERRTAAAPDPLPDVRRGVCRLRPGEAWLDDEGVRAAWGYVDRPEEEMDRLLAALPGSGINALWGPARRWWGALASTGADPARVQAARRGVARVTSGLAGTPVRWLAGVNVPGDDADLSRYPRAVALGGREIGIPSLVDPRFWDEVVAPRLVALAGEGRPLAGVVLDLEMYGGPILYYGDAFDFGDGPFRAFVDGAGGEAAAREAALRLPAATRADWLLAGGRLDDYFAFLEARAEAIGRRLREALDAAGQGRDLVLGFYAVGIMPHWFYRGLFRGASAGGRPVLLLTFQTEVHADVAQAAREGTCLYHAQAALLGLAGEDGLAPALARAARAHDGFWLNRVTHLVTSYPVAPHDAVEVPALRGEAGWEWVRKAVLAYEAGRPSR